MPIHSEKKNVPYSAEQMYALVSDVNSYSDFLPWCSASRVIFQKKEEIHEIVEADLIVSFKLFREKFRSRVTLWKKDLKIESNYLDGPFRKMHAQWEFENMQKGCDVKFFVEFEFKNKLLEKVIGVFFNEAMLKIVKAFEDRAASLYQ